MINKKTIDDIKNEIYELVGDEYTVLSDTYVNTNTKILMRHNICKNEYEVTPNKFISAGRRCPKCSRKKINEEEYIKNIEEMYGDEYSVLSKFNGLTKPIILRHNKCGYEYELKEARGILRGNKCAKCSNKLKSNIDEFKNKVYVLVGDEYTVLSDNYVNTNTKILIRHNKCKHEWEILPRNFIQGQRCPKCSRKMDTNLFKEKISSITNNEYELISEYVDYNTKVTIRHNICKNEYEVTPNNFIVKNRRCPKCSRNHLKSTEEFSEDIQNLVGNEYTVLGDYKNNKTKIRMRHNICGYEWDSRPNVFISNGSRCPKCSNSGVSNKENELLEFIKTNYKGTIIEHDRTVLDGKELDIYLPELSIAIEFDGLYWHSELYVEPNYHINKTQKCKEKGIQLIHIFEDDWDDKKDIVKDKLLYTINNTNVNKIYARKCYIKEIDSKVKNEFLEVNHIQGKDNSSIKLGLYYDEKLVAVMTFCKPRISLGQKGNSVYDYELSRYATLLNHSVIGGFSKLFKYFEKNYEWNKIITYADIKYSKGNVYFKNGFNLLHISKPTYWYINKQYKREYRYKYRKQNLKKLFPDIYSKDKTEHEIMLEANYIRIYDCGNYVFEYIKNREDK